MIWTNNHIYWFAKHVSGHLRVFCVVRSAEVSTPWHWTQHGPVLSRAWTRIWLCLGITSSLLELLLVLRSFCRSLIHAQDLVRPRSAHRDARVDAPRETRVSSASLGLLVSQIFELRARGLSKRPYDMLQLLKLLLCIM